MAYPHTKNVITKRTVTVYSGDSVMRHLDA